MAVCFIILCLIAMLRAHWVVHRRETRSPPLSLVAGGGRGVRARAGRLALISVMRLVAQIYTI